MKKLSVLKKLAIWLMILGMQPLHAEFIDVYHTNYWSAWNAGAQIQWNADWIKANNDNSWAKNGNVMTMPSNWRGAVLDGASLDGWVQGKSVRFILDLTRTGAFDGGANEKLYFGLCDKTTDNGQLRIANVDRLLGIEMIDAGSGNMTIRIFNDNSKSFTVSEAELALTDTLRLTFMATKKAGGGV